MVDGAETRLARIDYFCPSLCVDIETIFEQEIAEVLQSCHPKIVALNLEQAGASLEEVPRGSIEITLPISVQTVSSSISIKGKMCNGVMLMMVELMSFETKYGVKQKGKKVVFDDIGSILSVKKANLIDCVLYMIF